MFRKINDERKYRFYLQFFIHSLPGQTSGNPTTQLKSIITVIAYTIVSEFSNMLSQLFMRIRASLIKAGINERLVRLSMWNVAMSLVQNNRGYLHSTLSFRLHGILACWASPMYRMSICHSLFVNWYEVNSFPCFLSFPNSLFCYRKHHHSEWLSCWQHWNEQIDSWQ